MTHLRKASTLLLWAVLAGSTSVFAHFNPGDKIQTLTNLHPIPKKGVVYSLNYQQNALIPVCTEVEVKRISGKKMIFSWQGQDFTFAYDKHTRRAGVSYHDSLEDYFASRCDEEKIESLRPIDQEGIKLGKPIMRMSKYGILFAMGRPPHHANPDLGANTWTYWVSKHNRTKIVFNNDGFVTEIRN